MRALSKVFKGLLAGGCLVLTISVAAQAAVIRTDSAMYAPGEVVGVLGATFQSGETVQITILPKSGNTVLAQWETTANGSGNFLTHSQLGYYAEDGDTLRVSALGDLSGLYATTTFVVAITVNLDQLQNGTASTSPEWANGNINTTNSCYSEGDAVPFRYFIEGTEAGQEHYFTIQMQWTKGGIHAYDYLVDYDFSEADPLDSVGGPCGTIATTPPGDCATPTGSVAFLDPTDESNYSGTIPPDFFDSVATPPPFVLDGPANLKFYNATVDSLGEYFFTGTASDRLLNFKVYFTVTSTASVGFFWGGHLATSNAVTWGAGNGSASVSGAPYHMSARDFDDDGGKNQARSIQNGSICLAPDPTIECAAGQLECADLSSSCSNSSGADNFTWQIVGGSLDSGQGSSTVYYTATDDTVQVILTACNESSGCTGDFCCASDTALVFVSINVPPVATCPADQDLFLCELTSVCLQGFSCSDADGNLESCTVSSGTLDGDSVCFTPVAGPNVIQLIATDSCGIADTCSTTINVTLNAPPVATCPPDRDTAVCDLSPICIKSFSCSDPDGNLDSSYALGGTLAGDSVCFTPVVGVNLIKLVCVDSCGLADTCQTTVNVDLNTPPVAQCPPDDSILVCDLSPICIKGFSCTDVDNNLVSCVASPGVLDGDSICFTPVEGVNQIILVAEDECGQLGVDTCEFVIYVDVNSPPVTVCPPDRDTFVCDLSAICIEGFSVSDPDGNLVSSGAIGGTLLGDSICFVPVVGPNVIKLVGRDACDEADTCETTVNVYLNSPPTATCPADQNLFVCDLSPICIKGFVCDDPDLNLVSCSVNNGTLDGDSVCFTPVFGNNVIRLIATDVCGAADTCYTNVNVTLNSPPQALCPANVEVFACDLASPVCVPGFECVDPDGNIASCSVNLGSLNADTVCFVPVAGANVIRLIVVDACGLADTCFTTVTVSSNRPPEASCPAPVDMFVCNLQPICIGGFVCSDPDGNLTSCTAQGGTLSGEQVCFTPVPGANVIKLIATDSCGLADTCTATINVTLNQPPVALCPPDEERSVCDLSPICIDGFSCSDPDGNLATCHSPDGQLNGGEVCFTPVPGPNVIRLIATDDCGAVDTCMTFINVNLNAPPVVSCPDDTALLCGVGQEICLGPFTCSDEGLHSDELSFGVLDGDSVCFTPDTVGLYTLVYTCTDDCGATSSCTTTVYVSQPSIVIDTVSTLPGSVVEVCVKTYGLSFPWGGFDFLLNYDPLVLSLQEVLPGQFLVDCGWEYFTYRIVSSNPATVRVVAIADMNNSNIHPDCNTPDDGDEVFCLRFRVTSDWNIACQSSPIYFYWTDCGDNAISDPSGNILYIAGGGPGTVLGPGGEDLTGLGALGGPPWPCPADKFVPLPCLTFHGGKVRVICPDEIDDRGDLNMNAVAYEIADAVLYSQYFITGPSVFTVNFAGQVAASEINADGVPLTVADLVYLIRVITGDAQPIVDDLLGSPRMGAAATLSVSLETDGRQVTVGSRCAREIGAALFVFRTQGAAVEDVMLTSRAADMDLRFGTTPGELRVLIYNLEDRASIPAGEGDLFTVELSGEGSLEVVSVEGATFDGAVLESDLAARIIPRSFALLQNNPNPFNPTTTLAADFPVASDYSLVVYNIAGQVVRKFSGRAEAGRLSLVWDGRDRLGHSVASGVYFYALTAGDFHSIRKMVLMK